MALEIETGTGNPEALSYATVVELDQYAAARGLTLPSNQFEKEQLLIKSAAFLESFDYIGVQKTLEQGLAWPRTGAYLHGMELLDTVIPRKLIQAQLQFAIDAQTINLLPSAAPAERGAVIEETVEGAVSVKYAKPELAGGAVSASVAGGATLAAGMALLAPLLRGEDAWVLQARLRRG